MMSQSQTFRQVVYLLEAPTEAVTRFCSGTRHHVVIVDRFEYGVLSLVHAVSSNSQPNKDSKVCSTAYSKDYLSCHETPRATPKPSNLTNGKKSVCEYETRHSASRLLCERFSEIAKDLHWEPFFKTDFRNAKELELLMDRVLIGMFKPLEFCPEGEPPKLLNVDRITFAAYDVQNDRVCAVAKFSLVLRKNSTVASYRYNEKIYCHGEPRPDESKADEPTPDEPPPDEPTPDDPMPDRLTPEEPTLGEPEPLMVFLSKLMSPTSSQTSLLITDMPFLKFPASFPLSPPLSSYSDFSESPVLSRWAIILFSPCKRQFVTSRSCIFASGECSDAVAWRSSSQLLCSEFRIAHTAQLTDISRFLFEALLLYRAPWPLTAVRDLTAELGFWAPIYMRAPVAFALETVSSKQNGLTALHVFSSSKRAIFLPLLTSLPLDVQFRSLSLIPSSFLFKISDYWGNMQQKDAQDVLTQVSLLQYVFRQCVPYNRICIPTPLPTQRLLLDRFKFLELLASAVNAVNKDLCIDKNVATGPLCLAQHLCLDSGLLQDNGVNDEVLMNRVSFASIAPLRYPLLCKPRLGGGPPIAHCLGVAFSPKGVADFVRFLLPLCSITKSSRVNNALSDRGYEMAESLLTPIPFGVVLQDYVEHGISPVVLKIFVLGPNMYIQQQQSLPSPMTPEGVRELRLCADAAGAHAFPDCIILNSNIFKKKMNSVKSQSIAVLTAVAASTEIGDSGFEQNCAEKSADYYRSGPTFLQCEKALWKLTQVLQQRLKTSFFGYDVLVTSVKHTTNGTEEKADLLLETLVVVDINFFPSYSGISGLPEKIRKAALWRLER